MKYQIFKYNQNGYEFISVILPFSIVKASSKALVFGVDIPYGYQRVLNESKVNGIKRAILNGDLVSPTSIILGINRDVCEKLLSKESGKNYIDIEGDTIHFRIIDGQHRLAGFENASRDDPKILDYDLNIVIMMVEKDHRSKEVEIFNDINSKHVRVKIDLAILAKYNYQFLEKYALIDRFEQIAVNSIFDMVLKSNSIWKNGIRLDYSDKSAPGIIGFKSYYESILPIVKAYFKDRKDIQNLNLSNVQQFASEFNENVQIPIWNIVEQKWPDCFIERSAYFDNQPELIRYDEFYYIQKTVGVKAFFAIFAEQMRMHNTIDKSKDEFIKIISLSSLSSDDWGKNKVFEGFSSLSGMRVIISIIRNEKGPYNKH